MGAKCSNSRGQETNHQTAPAPGLHKASPGGHRNRMGFAEVGNLEAPAEKDPGGWGMKFAPQSEAPHNASDDESKAELARALSGKTTSSVRAKTSIVAKKGAMKVSEVLRGAGTVGLGALDTFMSSSVANLNNRGFALGALSKGNKIGILAFEVANTIVKGATLKMSLGEEDIRTLKEQVLVSEGVHRLVSTNSEELLLIAAADKKNELKVYADEVVRFGNLCRDPQWHGYDRIFHSLVKEREITRLSREEANKIMDHLMDLAQNTADLYHELHALDRFRTDLKRKQQEEESAGGRGGETVALLKSEVKSQEKHVEALKKRSLWSRTLEEVMEHLVDIANYLYQEINDHFGPEVFLEAPEEEAKRNAGKLGSSGLALHYANLIQQIDSLVLRPGSVPPSTRDNLYQGLPQSVKSALKYRLQDPTNGGDLSLNFDEVKEDLSKILDWLVPVASNTTKAHHGFGWVGEWANTGSPADRKAMGYVEITLIQTLHYAKQQEVEKYILELVVLLHHLVSLAMTSTNTTTNNLDSGEFSPHRSPPAVVKPAMPEFLIQDRSASPPPFGMFSSAEYTQGLAQQLAGYILPPGVIRPELSQEDKDMLCNMGSEYTQRRLIPGLSKSQEFDTSRAAAAAAAREYLKLSKSSSHSQASAGQLEAPLYRPRHRIKPLNIHYERESDVQ